MIPLPLLLLLLAVPVGHATAALAPLLHSQRQRSAPAVGMDAAEIRPFQVAAIVLFFFFLLDRLSIIITQNKYYVNMFHVTVVYGSATDLASYTINIIGPAYVIYI